MSAIQESAVVTDRRKDKTQNILRILRSILSRITPEKFDPAGDGSEGNAEERLRGTISLIFKMAVWHPSKTSSCDQSSFIIANSLFVPHHYFWLVSRDGECSSLCSLLSSTFPRGTSANCQSSVVRRSSIGTTMMKSRLNKKNWLLLQMWAWLQILHITVLLMK